MNILNTQQEPPEPDYLIMKPASPMESHNVKRNEDIENCFKCGHTNYMFGVHGANFYDNEFVRDSSSLATSPKPGYLPGNKEPIQYKDKRQIKNHAISSYKFRHCVTIAVIFIFIITG